MAGMVKINTTFQVNVNGEMLGEMRTLHGGLCFAFRLLHTLLDINGWKGQCEMATVYRTDDDESSIETVLVAESFDETSIIVKRWDVESGRCNRCRWVDDDSANGRIEMV